MLNLNINPNTYNATLSDRTDRMNYGGHSGNPTKTPATDWHSASTHAYYAEAREARATAWGYNGGSCIE